MNRILLIASIIQFVLVTCLSAQVSGIVTDENGHPLPYVNIYIKGTSIGTTSNIEGYYLLKLEEESVSLVYQYIGYRTKTINLGPNDNWSDINISLEPEEYQIDEVTISANAEDPAYAIIRKAQAKRKYYKNLVQHYACDAYVRGFNKLLDAPEKIMGVEVGDMDGLLDSTRQGVVYLSESVSKLYYKNGNFKEVMYSSKISGNDQGYSFNSAKEMSFDFYGSTIDLNRKIISPIAPAAMSYYDYKLEGAEMDENGQLINKIRVIPKDAYSPCFHGHIYINEDLWNYHSIELGVTSKATQLAFIDSLTFAQVFVPLEKETWMPFSNVIEFKMKAFGFVLKGNFAAVYSNYNLSEIEDGIFNAEVFKVEKEANERSRLYWDTLRPIPLTVEEERDYIEKDSIRKVKESPEYLDSIDKVANRFKFGNILGGYSFQNSIKQSRFSISSPLSKININTIQGWNGEIAVEYGKNYNKDKTRRLNISVIGNYGFSEKEFRPRAEVRYLADRVNNLIVRASGGHELKQFNRSEPISERLNTIMTYFFRRNYLKAYDRKFAFTSVTRDIGNVFRIGVSMEYERRNAVINNYTSSLFYKDSRNFTSNDPTDPMGTGNLAFEPHTALFFRANLRIKIGEKVWRYPNRKFKVGSDWPTLRLFYKKGFGSDISYDLAYATLYKTIDIGAIGTTSLFGMGGSYFGESPEYFMDKFHFYGNQTHIGYPANYDHRFLILPYYANSTGGDFYQFHWQHNFKGFLLGKIPGLKVLGWHLAGGIKLLDSSDNAAYREIHVGIDNIGWHIFRMFRVDFVWANQANLSVGEAGDNRFGIVTGIKIDL